MIIWEALQFATKAHAGQLRKYTHEPYIAHPMSVAGIVSTVSHSPQMIQAAILHDVVEDTDVTIQEISLTFGSSVSEMVWGLTDQSKPSDGNRKHRKKIDREHLAQQPPHTQTIKVADLIDNSKTIVPCDPNFARVYLREKQDLLEVLTKADTTLLEIVNKIIMDFYLARNEARHGG